MDDIIKFDSTNTLFIDPGSQVVGIAQVNINYTTKEATILMAAPLWYGSDWDEGKKLRFLFNSIRNFYFIMNGGVTEVVCEEWFMPIGPNAKVSGSTIIPELIGTICLAAADEDPALDFKKISAQKWRGLIGVKADVSEHPTLKDKKGNPQKVKDYKTPVERYVKGIINIPETYISNITHNERQTPNDLTDVLGLAFGVLKSRGINKIKAAKDWDKLHLGTNLLG